MSPIVKPPADRLRTGSALPPQPGFDNAPATPATPAATPAQTQLEQAVADYNAARSTAQPIPLSQLTQRFKRLVPAVVQLLYPDPQQLPARGTYANH